MIKDIKLIQTDTGGYDWKFDNSDVNIVTNNDRLVNAVIHSVMLKPYEIECEEYIFKGNGAYDYLLEKQTEHVRNLIENSIKTSCEKIEGVQGATVEINFNDVATSVKIILLKGSLKIKLNE